MSNKQVSQLTKDLLQAKELLNTEEDWCQGALHHYGLEGKISRCAFGALHDAVGKDRRRYGDGCHVLNIAAEELFTIPPEIGAPNTTYTNGPTKPATYVNDIIGFEGVHKMFDRAIMNSMAKETAECQ